MEDGRKFNRSRKNIIGRLQQLFSLIILRKLAGRTFDPHRIVPDVWLPMGTSGAASVSRSFLSSVAGTFHRAGHQMDEVKAIMACS